MAGYVAGAKILLGERMIEVGEAVSEADLKTAGQEKANVDQLVADKALVTEAEWKKMQETEKEE